MQPQDSLTVARRPMDIEDYIDVIRRHKAWIFGPTFAGLVIAVVVAFLWPNTYVSSAIIRVVPPQVPESYVPPNITTDIQGRINGLTQVILNRASLTAIINKYQLYRKEMARMPTDDIIDQMRTRDIHISPVQTLSPSSGTRQVMPAFVLAFSYRDRHLAQKVVEELSTNFITESQREGTEQSIGTTELLQAQWESAKKRLDD